KWRQTRALAVFLVVFLESDDQLSPEIVRLRFRAFSNAESGPRFDGEAGTGTNVVVRTTVNVFEALQELLSGFAGKRPLAELISFQAQHFPNIAKPFDMS